MSESRYESADYSAAYLSFMASAFKNSESFNFRNKPRVSLESSVSDQELKSLEGYIFDEVYPHVSNIRPGYWGNSCQVLSTHIFAILTSMGMAAEIVIGEVEVNGTLEFDTTLEELYSDYISTEILDGGQKLHAWVSLGGDIIIDAGLPDRMIKNYKFPADFMPPIIVSRASEISRKFRARHQPLILGTDFFAKTNPPDPLEVVALYKKDRNI